MAIGSPTVSRDRPIGNVRNRPQLLRQPRTQDSPLTIDTPNMDLSHATPSAEVETLLGTINSSHALLNANPEAIRTIERVLAGLNNSQGSFYERLDQSQ